MMLIESEPFHVGQDGKKKEIQMTDKKRKKKHIDMCQGL